MHDMGGSIMPVMVKQGPAYVYDFKDNDVPGSEDRDRGYWRDVGTLDAYYDAHMDLVAVHPIFNLYNQQWPIYTHHPQLPPAKFVEGGIAQESIVALAPSSPARRCGTACSRRTCGCTPARTSRARCCMDGVQIGRGAVVRRAILDKNVVVPEGAHIGVDLELDRSRYHVSRRAASWCSARASWRTLSPRDGASRNRVAMRCTRRYVSACSGFAVAGWPRVSQSARTQEARLCRALACSVHRIAVVGRRRAVLAGCASNSEGRAGPTGIGDAVGQQGQAVAELLVPAKIKSAGKLIVGRQRAVLAERVQGPERQDRRLRRRPDGRGRPRSSASRPTYAAGGLRQDHPVDPGRHVQHRDVLVHRQQGARADRRLRHLLQRRHPVGGARRARRSTRTTRAA